LTRNTRVRNWPSKESTTSRSRALSQTVRTSLHAAPERPDGGSGIPSRGIGLRRRNSAGDYPGRPAAAYEAELVATTGLKPPDGTPGLPGARQRGVVYRVRGRGTFAVPGDGKYLGRSAVSTILMALSLDTEMQVSSRCTCWPASVSPTAAVRRRHGDGRCRSCGCTRARPSCFTAFTSDGAWPQAPGAS